MSIMMCINKCLHECGYRVYRYVVGADRVLFMLKDGSYAWEIKDFLISQERCEVVTIEGQDFPGKGSKQVQNPLLCFIL